MPTCWLTHQCMTSHVPDYLAKSMCLGHRCNEPGGGDCNIAFSARLPGGIQLSQLPDLQSMHKAMGPQCRWLERRLWSHDVYKLVAHASGMCTLHLGVFFTVSSRTVLLTRTRCVSSFVETTGNLESTMVSHSLPSCVLSHSAHS